MEVKAIHNFSLQNMENNKLTKRAKSANQSYPQMDSPVSYDASQSLKSMINFTAKKDGKPSKAERYLRNLAVGTTMATAVTNTACSPEDFGIHAEAHAAASDTAWAYAEAQPYPHGRDTTVIYVKGDTVYLPSDPEIVHDTIKGDTIYVPTDPKIIHVKEYPKHIGDSLLWQGINIGIPIDGPDPRDENDVVFVASKAFNRYDQKLYETKLDSVETNRQKLSLITKVTDFYNDPKNPKISWMRTGVVDVPGKGIKLTREVANTTYEPYPDDWTQAGYEIRTNNRHGKNILSIFDNDRNLVWKGEYIKGENPGSFLYGTYVYDDDGNIFLDDDGNPVTTEYDFDQAKMWSEKVQFIESNGKTYYWGK